MKTIRVYELGDPEVLKLEDVSDLEPAEDELLLEIKAIGVNPVDTYIRAGIHFKPALPYTPGFDAAGVIKKVGKGVKKFKVGDKVYTDGTLTGAYAEKALCKENQVHSLPESITFEQGAAIGIPYATAYRALFIKAKATSKDFVLVHGASGGVGVASVQLAKQKKMTVIGTAGTEKGEGLLKNLGIDFVFNHRDPDYLKKMMEAIAGRGVDIILEMLANVNLGNDLTVLAENGRVVVIGCRGTVTINPREAMHREAFIMGMRTQSAPDKERMKIHADLIEGLEKGYLNPVVGRKFSLQEASIAHKAILEPGAYGKMVLIP